MKKQEGAIITAYTGILIGCPKEFHSYATELLGYNIMTHEFADKKVWVELKKLSEDDFMELNRNIKD